MKLVLGIEITGSLDYFKIRNNFGMANIKLNIRENLDRLAK